MRGLGGRHSGGPICRGMPSMRGRRIAGRVEGRMHKRVIPNRPTALSSGGERPLPLQADCGGL